MRVYIWEGCSVTRPFHAGILFSYGIGSLLHISSLFLSLYARRSSFFPPFRAFPAFFAALQPYSHRIPFPPFPRPSPKTIPLVSLPRSFDLLLLPRVLLACYFTCIPQFLCCSDIRSSHTIKRIITAIRITKVWLLASLSLINYCKSNIDYP